MQCRLQPSFSPKMQKDVGIPILIDADGRYSNFGRSSLSFFGGILAALALVSSPKKNKGRGNNYSSWGVEKEITIISLSAEIEPLSLTDMVLGVEALSSRYWISRDESSWPETCMNQSWSRKSAEGSFQQCLSYKLIPVPEARSGKGDISSNAIGDSLQFDGNIFPRNKNKAETKIPEAGGKGASLLDGKADYSGPSVFKEGLNKQLVSTRSPA
ncbi:hypothetical protein BJ508DRAFT_339294 [Ascobolus immersus RN42]|uniref:Uncharacterized protein n=1 Tax=Ascobolus immersus RN42 TaxID=1160509 RepID=A0A3N4HMJ0_ASCIM|nr:hypothetical protein BJ508DRAFT_339294 [Ascobolus immersus RN42]